MQHYKYNERKVIEEMLIQKKSIRAISRELNRSHSTVLYEIKVNTLRGSPYNADYAQIQHENKLKKRRRTKLQQYPELLSYVIDNLKNDLTPKQISGRLKKENSKITISHETIYKLIYSKEYKKLHLWSYLMYRRPKRNKWKPRYKGYKIPERLSIHNRPNEINARTIVGHWETDLMIFSSSKKVLSVQVERTLKLVRLYLCENKTAIEKNNALVYTIDSLPQHMFLSYTYDNGTENVLHTSIRDDYCIQTFFCDGYSSWQKGTVENTNKLLRRYFPRYISIDLLTDEYVKEIEDKMNNIPRESLNFLTPNEALKFYLNGEWDPRKHLKIIR